MQKIVVIVCLIGLLILFCGCTQSSEQPNSAANAANTANVNNTANANNISNAKVCPEGVNVWVSKIQFGNPATQFSSSDSVFVIVKSDVNCEQKVKASLFDPEGNLVSMQEYNIPQGLTGYNNYNPNQNLAAGNYTFEIKYNEELLKTIPITVISSEASVPNESLSEQPSKEKFNEYFTEAYLGKLPLGVQVGPPNFPTRTTVFTSADQFCSNLTIIKAIPAGKLGTAVYDIDSNQYIQPKSNFPMELKTGGSSGCETLGFPPGNYEYKLYVDDMLAAVLPFEIK